MSVEVQKYMTTHPHTIGDEQKIPKALEVMREFGVRHLPVLRGGKLVGIISDRDIRIAEKLYTSRVGDIALSEVIQGNPNQVAPTDSLRKVAAQMAQDKVGSSLVVDAHGKLLGIFTEVDAFRALADLA